MEKTTAVLNSGIRIPVIGFGTYKAGDTELLREAIRAGYRLFDTASFYGTEQALGQAVRESGIPRPEFFLCSKLWKTEMGYEAAKRALGNSLAQLQAEQIDMYMIHWPKPAPDCPEWRFLLRETWKALEELCRDGYVRSIGVSNFLPHHLQVILDDAQILPALNQLEFHPGYTQDAARLYCRQNGILVEAWSPLGRTRMLEDPLLREIGEAHSVSPAQVCLRYAYEEGVIPIPKASSPERMRENLDIFRFSLTEEERWRLATMPPAGWSGEHPDRERVYFDKK